MGWKLHSAVWRSALPGRLKPMAAALSDLVLDSPKGDKPAHTLFASMNTIARHRGVHLNVARRQVHALVEYGLLEEVSPGGGRRLFGAGAKRHVGGISTVYRFHPEVLPQYPARNGGESGAYPTQNGGESTAYPTETGRAIAGNKELTGNVDPLGCALRGTTSPKTAQWCVDDIFGAEE